MTIWSTILIIPAALREAGNAIAQQMQWGPGCYSVPLSADGSSPATHYALEANTSDTFKGWIEGTIPLPEGMEAAQTVIDALIPDFSDTLSGLAHFEAVLTANGLVRVEPVE